MTEDTISEECVGDLEEQIKYLGKVNWLIYHSEEVLVDGKYAKDAVHKQSILINQ